MTCKGWRHKVLVASWDHLPQVSEVGRKEPEKELTKIATRISTKGPDTLDIRQRLVCSTSSAKPRDG